jgi:hypothetical protein
MNILIVVIIDRTTEHLLSIRAQEINNREEFMQQYG